MEVDLKEKITARKFQIFVISFELLDTETSCWTELELLNCIMLTLLSFHSDVTCFIKL